MAKKAGAHQTADEPTEQQTIFTEQWNGGRRRVKCQSKNV